MPSLRAGNARARAAGQPGCGRGGGRGRRGGLKTALQGKGDAEFCRRDMTRSERQSGIPVCIRCRSRGLGTLQVC